MARNVARTMTADERMRAFRATNVINSTISADGSVAYRAVAFDYVKDNGERSHRVGTFVAYSGKDSTASVTVDTDKGPRTFNLRNMVNVTAQ